jgi:hypothetical protein
VTSSTTPQDRAVEALVQKFNPHYAEYPLAPLSPRGVSAMTSFTASDGHRSIKPLNLGEIVDCLADAGLLSSGTQEEGDGSLRSEPPADGDGLVDVVAEALRERPFLFGPNTRDSITRGMDKVFLTGNERRDLARMALEAVAEAQKEEA